MSIYDEQEIERLRAVNEKLHWALRASEQKLKEAMQLLSEACCDTSNKIQGEIWDQRRVNLGERYYNHKD